MPALVDRIDALLPQTQCTNCGFPTCRAYAAAIASETADIDRCAPGGADGIAALAALLDRASKPLNPAYGREAPPVVAFIDEEVCIGCTKCIQACPVDAIVGAAKRMHTILASECTGCGLCLPPCPVDCISLPAIADAPLSRAQVLARAAATRARFEARNARQAAPTSRPPVGAASAAMLALFQPKGIAAEAAPAISGGSIVTEAAPAKPKAASPISRSAVLDAIARGKARRAHKDPADR